MDYSTENIKASGMAKFRLKPSLAENSPELTVAGNFAQGSTIFQGATRFRLEDIRYVTGRVELSKRNKYFLRAYITQDDAGKTYNPFVTALKLQELQMEDETFAARYQNIWLTNFQQKVFEMGHPNIEFVNGMPFFDHDARDAFYQNPTILDSLASWHQQTITLLNSDSGPGINPFLQPGTPEFQEAFNEINGRLSNNEDFDVGGSRLFTRSELFHIAGEYIFEPSWMNKITVGGNARMFTPDTRGTIFGDVDEKFTNREIGFYGGFEKKFLEDKMTLSGTF